ncbi:hypothetical protein MTR67_010233 [Solanum verrucosum]|uniref:Uncharacterized protein n=1 Tax=Solanum verrucosum TaxID=315347 RepID=A0AAF0Q5R5_SOLVR|nr:uncharacterized protein LOC125822364 [Solanum verrucosum]WMV16848.1 hypothetical protein MTR67_010233 [Solanum verrucosum]
MAIELCSDDSSPRFSFSQDISQTDSVQIPSTNSSSSTIDFDFCVFHQTFDLQSTSADELFLDGKILPIEMKRKNIPPSIPPNKKSDQNTPIKSHKLGIPSYNAYNASVKNESLSTDEKQSSKSFWRFKRSNSTSSTSSYVRTLCPLPILSRSNSTGSTPNMKHKHHFHKSSSSASSSNGHYQKPPLRKVPGYINGIKISPVLNVPTANLFGLSSLFSSSKEKNKKR